ncbi:MAG: nitroreductase family protein [Candidatus Pacearchaeota archaeon]
MKLEDAIRKRRSVKKFSTDKPNWRKIISAIDLARISPSAGNLFVMRFILVRDEEKIKKIAEATQQPFVGSVNYIVVAVSDDSKLVRSFGNRGIRYASLQAGAAIENLLLALTDAGLVTTWVGHFYDEQIKDVLNIPDNLNIEGVFPIGKETKIKTVEKPKAELDNILYFDKWENKKMNAETITMTK